MRLMTRLTQGSPRQEVVKLVLLSLRLLLSTVLLCCYLYLQKSTFVVRICVKNDLIDGMTDYFCGI